MNLKIDKITGLILMSVGFLFLACREDHSVLDAGTQPGNDGLNAEQLTDLPVTAHTILADSIASFKERYKFFGSNNDPVFGKTDVGLYTKMVLTVANFNLGPTASLTSAEIVMAYNAQDYLGDPGA